MGQPIEVDIIRLDDVTVFDTDRSISGQDGEGYTSEDQAALDDTFPAELAQRLFSADDQITHVYAFSNAVSVERSGGWSDEAVTAAVEILSNFFVYYEENRSPSGGP